MSEYYLAIFAEAYLRYFMLPIGSQIVLPAMKYFGGYDMLVPNILAGAGILLAMLTSFMVGIGFARLRIKHFPHTISEERYTAISRVTSRWGWPLLLLVGLPFGTLVPVILGFFFRKQ
ncbi:MAG: hypothetical protein U1E36_09115 [Rickettsiales bacterium]